MARYESGRFAGVIRYTGQTKVEPCQLGHEHTNKAVEKMHLRKRQPGSSTVSGFLSNRLFKEINMAASNEILKDV